MKHVLTLTIGTTFLLLLFTEFSTAQSTPTAFAQSCPSILGPVTDPDGTTWNAIAKGNWEATGADTEGRLAVGGNLIVGGSYAIGAGNSKNQLSQSNGTRDDLIVGGNFTNNGGNWQVFNGNAVYGGSISGTPPSFGGTGNQLISDPNTDPDRFDFDGAFNTFESISQSLASLSQNGSVYDNGYGTVTLTGNDPALNVFEINSSMIDTWGISIVINVPPTSTVIINIPDNTFTLDGGDFGTDIRERVILNFYNATEVNVSSFAVLGSVLAPFADFNGNGGNVNGHMIIGGDVYQTGGFEPHHYPFEGCVTLKASLGDYVWFDENGNGIQDNGEPGVEGVNVALLDENENFIELTQTDSNGYYLFSDLDPGTYIVNFEAPEGFDFTIKGAGSDIEKDSNVNLSSGNTDPITLSAGQTRLDIDAGLEETITTTENQNLTITVGPCWRTFASPFQQRSYDGENPINPVQDFTYNNLIGQWWTQGVPGSDHPSATESNILLWPLNTDEDTDAGWTTSGLNLNDQIPGGKGFLMSVFTDDEFGTPGDWGKTVSFTYNPDDIYPAPYTVSVSAGNLNSQDNGWSLLGNPFDEAVDFKDVANSSTGITGVAYIYDRNKSPRDDGPGGIDENLGSYPGGWRTVNEDGIGDITDDLIPVFQGFFVQNDDVTASSTREVVFTEESKSGPTEFYGKQHERSFIRLELSGEGLFNSSWITLSEDGGFDRLYGDAYELHPFTEHYALFGTRKGDEIFDIGRFPLQDGVEIPMVIETTLSGEYTISATDFQIPPGTELLFVDKEKNISLPVDENFSYIFITHAVQQKGMGLDALPCGATQQQIADFFRPQQAKAAGNDRFVLVVNPDNNSGGNNLPSTIELKQNYPNPFNPTTQITYQLPELADVRLEVYDMAGRQVATLVNNRVNAGTHTINFNATDLSSGIYLYRLQAGTTVLTRKLTLIK